MRKSDLQVLLILFNFVFFYFVFRFCMSYYVLLGAKVAPGRPTCARNATSTSFRRARGDFKVVNRALSQFYLILSYLIFSYLIFSSRW